MHRIVVLKAKIPKHLAPDWKEMRRAFNYAISTVSGSLEKRCGAEAVRNGTWVVTRQVEILPALSNYSIERCRADPDKSATEPLIHYTGRLFSGVGGNNYIGGIHAFPLRLNKKGTFMLKQNENHKSKWHRRSLNYTSAYIDLSELEK